MSDNAKLCIQVAERFCREEDEKTNIMHEWYHCHLSLTYDLPHPNAEEVLQEIHLVPDELGYIQPRFYRGAKQSKLDKTTFFPIFSGKPEDITTVWNHMGQFADSLNDAAIFFGSDPRYSPDSINCRTGVRDILKIGGFKLYNEFTLSAAGMYAPTFAVGRKYQHYTP